MTDQNPKMKVLIHFTGRGVKANKIEVLRLGDFFSNFQRLLFEYGKAKGIKKPQEHLKLYLTKISPGSVLVETEPTRGYHRYVEPTSEAIDFIITLIQYVDDIEKAKEYLLKELKTPEAALSALKRLERIWSEEDIQVGIAKDHEPTNFVYLPPEKKPYVERLVDEFIKEASDKVIGAIVGLKTHGRKPYFEIISDTGEKIKCYYDPREDPELEMKAYEHFWKPVEVIGLLKQKGRKKEVEKTIDLQPHAVKISGEFAGYKLQKELTLYPEYDHTTDVWCVENPGLEIYGCGKTLNEALKDAEEVFEALIEEYLLEDEEILNDKAKELRETLLQHVEVNP